MTAMIGNHSLKWQRWLVLDLMTRCCIPCLGWCHDGVSHDWLGRHDAVSRVGRTWCSFPCLVDWHDAVFHVWLYYGWHVVVSHARFDMMLFPMSGLAWCCIPCPGIVFYPLCGLLCLCVYVASLHSIIMRITHALFPCSALADTTLFCRCSSGTFYFPLSLTCIGNVVFSA